ncbi:ABC transporter [Paenibacillus baekrokdamisoli]|uniref:ABC transporter n=1 Tax=Paenibacillus baekrokdamisoli TaxID=1712516 RepID=A0A3G9JCM6_9BACL|nr:ABC transporter ATP-binding protein [Paenibacillus baekrokdamisoli]MBB3069938.1 ABC-2 type transport system ATP-binding protein [Paenibacillus baekrokdamisoli]BBH20709.1 ABC transporter [Paenibacillus baekrokdamisoli]
MSILEINKVSKQYRNQRGIRQIDLSLKKGDVYGLLGPNGSGKTTLLKTITGLIRADEGTVALFGQRIDEVGGVALQRVGCMIESADFYDFISAYQHLKLVANFYPSISDKQIFDVLELVGLQGVAKERIKHFSTGMKQKLALAAAILPEPELIILDEPTNGLDIEGIVLFREVVRRLSEEKGMTFILSSHMIHELEQLCNRVGIIYGGALIQEGSVSDLLQDGLTLEHYYIEQLRMAKEA